MIHLQLIFVYGLRKGGGVQHHFFAYRDIQLSQHRSFKKTILFP